MDADTTDDVPGHAGGRLLVSPGTRDDHYDSTTAWRVHQGDDGGLTVSTAAWGDDTLGGLSSDWYADPASAIRRMPADVADQGRRALRDAATRGPAVPGDPATALAVPGGSCPTTTTGMYRAFADAFRAGTSLVRPEAVPGLEFADRHRPAQDALGVGGDWYDVFTLDDGRAALVIGDVQGHGVGAAPMMARIRTLLRAYAVVTSDPGRALGMVNDFLERFPGPAQATCTLAYLDPRGCSLQVARAAHPPLLLADADGYLRIEDVDGGLPLGMLGGQRYPCTAVAMTPGETLVLATDGLVEGPRLTLDQGIERLAARLARSHGCDLDTTAERLFGLSDTTGHRDDATLLLTRCHGGRVPLRSAAPG